MKNRSTRLIILFFTITSFLANNTLVAGPVEKSTAEAARKVVNDLKISAVTTKAQLDIITKDLTAQRSALQQKIRSTRQEFRNNIATLKNSSRKALDDLHSSLNKLKSSTLTAEDSHDADTLITQSANDEASLNQANNILEGVPLPKEISD